MIWVLSRNREMSLRKEIACWIVLLLLFHLEASCSAGGSGRFGRLKNGYASHSSPLASRGGFGEDEARDGVFDVEKRKVRTGPNPLHNRR